MIVRRIGRPVQPSSAGGRHPIELSPLHLWRLWHTRVDLPTLRPWSTLLFVALLPSSPSSQHATGWTTISTNSRGTSRKCSSTACLLPTFASAQKKPNASRFRYGCLPESTPMIQAKRAPEPAIPGPTCTTRGPFCTTRQSNLYTSLDLYKSPRAICTTRFVLYKSLGRSVQLASRRGTICTTRVGESTLRGSVCLNHRR